MIPPVIQSGTGGCRDSTVGGRWFAVTVGVAALRQLGGEVGARQPPGVPDVNRLRERAVEPRLPAGRSLQMSPPPGPETGPKTRVSAVPHIRDHRRALPGGTRATAAVADGCGR